MNKYIIYYTILYSNRTWKEIESVPVEIPDYFFNEDKTNEWEACSLWLDSYMSAYDDYQDIYKYYMSGWSLEDHSIGLKKVSKRI